MFIPFPISQVIAKVAFFRIPISLEKITTKLPWAISKDTWTVKQYSNEKKFEVRTQVTQVTKNKNIIHELSHQPTQIGCWQKNN